MEKLPKVIASVLVEKDGKFLLVKEKLESGKEYWIVPGGKVEFGETIEQAALREIAEETGLNINLTGFIGYDEAIVTKYDYHTVIFFYHGEPIDKKEIVLPNVKYFSLEEIKNLELVDTARWVFEKLGLAKF